MKLFKRLFLSFLAAAFILSVPFSGDCRQLTQLKDYDVPFLLKTTAPTVNDTYAVPYMWIDTSTDKAYLLTDKTAGAAVWREVGSGSPYGGVIIVAGSGGDYSDLSDAIDAATTNDTVLVYPGTYTDTMTFAANGVTVIGVGKAQNVIATQADASVVDFNIRTNIQIRNMTLQITAATTAIATITGTTGSCIIKECFSRMVTAATLAQLSQPCVGELVEVAFDGTDTHLAFVDGLTGEDTLTDSDSGFVTDGFAVGQTVTIAGATTGANDGDHVITGVVAGTLNFATGSWNTAEAGAIGMTMTAGSGKLTLHHGKVDYFHTGSGAGAIKGAFKVGDGGLIHVGWLHPLTITNSGTATATSINIDLSSTGSFEMHNTTATITDPNATSVVALAYLGGTGTTHEFIQNTINVVATNNNGYAFWSADTASTTTTGHNTISVTDVAGHSYGFLVAASATVASNFDNVIAADGNLITGTFKGVSIYTHGDLDITGEATVNNAVLSGGTNTFKILNGTASLDVAAAAVVDIDKSLTVGGQAVTITGHDQANTVTLYESLTAGAGHAGTLTFSAASKTATVEDNVTVGLDINALEGLASTGLVARTAANAYSERTITGTANQISVTNGNGVSGNPTLSIDLNKDIVTTAPVTGGTDNILVGAEADVTIAITMLGDIVAAGTGMSGGADNVLPGGDADVTITLTTSKDLVAGTGLTGGEDNVLPGAEADVTFAVDGILEDLDTLGAPASDGQIIVATGAGAYAHESGDTARISLGVGSSDSPIFEGLTPSTKTDSYVVTTSDFGKSLRMNSASDKNFTLPSVGTTEDGARLTFIKQGAGKMTATAVDTDYIHDSSATGTIYTISNYATITLEYVHGMTRWVIISATGTFVTT